MGGVLQVVKEIDQIPIDFPDFDISEIYFPPSAQQLQVLSHLFQLYETGN